MWCHHSLTNHLGKHQTFLAQLCYINHFIEIVVVLVFVIIEQSLHVVCFWQEGFGGKNLGRKQNELRKYE